MDREERIRRLREVLAEIRAVGKVMSALTVIFEERIAAGCSLSPAEEEGLGKLINRSASLRQTMRELSLSLRDPPPAS
jgi:hypothetical protein